MSELKRLRGPTIELDKEKPSSPTNKNKSVQVAQSALRFDSCEHKMRSRPLKMIWYVFESSQAFL